MNREQLKEDLARFIIEKDGTVNLISPTFLQLIYDELAQEDCDGLEEVLGAALELVFERLSEEIGNVLEQAYQET